MHLRILASLIASAALITDCLRAEPAVAAVTNGQTIKIVLVGDSTVTDTAGWGLGFKQFVNERVVCVNTAVGGRSSMSFIKEGRWEKALALKADYYLIQFGHNNEPGKPGRSTDMPTFASNIVQYVEDARAIGAKPILVTPLTRRQWDEDQPGKIKLSLAPYATEVRKIAAEKNCPLVNLHARSIELCESLGSDRCLELSPFAISNNRTNYDSTHLNAKGGVVFAHLVVDELRKAAPELAACLRSEPGPVAPPKIYHVDDFGAKGDGKTLDTAAIQRALDVCGQAGGGIVHFTPGTYLTTPIFLRGNTNLRLDAGATLQATDDPEDFADPNRPGAVRALVNANGVNAVAITGNGIIDGAGKRWWDPVRAAQKAGQPEPRRRPRLVVLSNCVDVRLEDVTLQNSPSFHLVPVDCENVSISGMVIQAPPDAPNTDAIDPSACRYVTIHDCLLDVGDDNIAIKSGHSDPAHPNAACEHIVIQDVGFLHGHGMSIGSETLGGVRNLVVSNCMFSGTTSGIRIKSARGRGGPVENILYQNLTMKDVDYPIYLTSYYPKVPTNDVAQPVAASSPVYRNIVIRNVTANSAKTAGMIVGLPESPVENVTLENVHVTAPTGLTLRNTKTIKLQNTTVTPTKGGKPFILETQAEVEGLPKQ